MKLPSRGACLALVLGLVSLESMAHGLATRELNPILQPVFLPVYLDLNRAEGWQFEHRLFVTNTYQEQSRGGESLVIDIENYRYEFSPRYRRGDWLLRLNLPLVASREGQLDTLIEDWHDFFGLPQGGRPAAERDQIDIEYRRDGVVEFVQEDASDGLADVSLTLGYHPPGETGYFLGIELPSGAEEDFSGNESIDWGIWLQREVILDENTQLYGLLGIGFPGDDGALADLLAERVWVVQLGVDYRFHERLVATLQFDLHSAWFDDSDLKAFRDSLQMQLGLGIDRAFGKQRLDLFFSEDIQVGSAPDISFGARLSRPF